MECRELPKPVRVRVPSSCNFFIGGFMDCVELLKEYFLCRDKVKNAKDKRKKFIIRYCGPECENKGYNTDDCVIEYEDENKMCYPCKVFFFYQRYIKKYSHRAAGILRRLRNYVTKKSDVH
jgi:hypothetical protein